MSTTVQTVNGYEILALCGTPSNESIEFNEYRADLNDGYVQKVNYGSKLGLKSWSLGFKNLKGGSADTDVIVNGTTTNAANYLWDLFCRSKNGTVFVIKSPKNDQYYLAEFADTKLTYERLLIKLFNSSINFNQIRIPGVTVFDPTKMSGLWARYGPANQALDTSGNSRDLVTHGNVSAGGGTTQNSLATMRFNGGSTNTGYLGTPLDPIIKEAFFVLKINEAAFSNFGGILTDDGSGGLAFLTGDQSTTKFYNQIFGTPYEYRKNGIPYGEGNQQAPMNVFGVVHIRYTTGLLMTNMQIGKDRANSGRFAEMDLGDAWLFTSLNLVSDSLEFTDYLATLWAIRFGS